MSKIVYWLLSTILVLSLLGILLFYFMKSNNDTILQRIIIRNNSKAFLMWTKPTVHPLMKVHIFNYTNWDLVVAGVDQKLYVQDIGPFVYTIHTERVNISFEGDKLSFQDINSFIFLPDESVGSHYDEVTVPNVPLIGMINKVVYKNFLVQSALSSLVSSGVTNKEAFLKLTMNEFLWGYEDSIVQIMKPFFGLQERYDYENFGILVNEKRISDRITINNGENDINRMNMIEKINNKEKLSYWGGDQCNSIEASYTTSFPPSMLDRHRTLYVFFPSLCRRLPLEYIMDVEIDGIKLLRYAIPLDIFDDPANDCYCDKGSGTCPLKGLLNVTECDMAITPPGAALASLPHFLHADPALRDKIDGLSPDPDLHQSYLDIHPTLGVALRGSLSFQLNIEVKKSRAFASLKSLSVLDNGLIVPVAWIEMTVPELPENLRHFVYTDSTSKQKATV